MKKLKCLKIVIFNELLSFSFVLEQKMCFIFLIFVSSQKLHRLKWYSGNQSNTRLSVAKIRYGVSISVPLLSG